MFSPCDGARRPVYSAGHERDPDKQILFTCPQALITSEVWELLMLWWNCRLMKCLPMAGGFLDQSKTIRNSFPVFEAQYRLVEQTQGQEGALMAAQTAMVGLMAAMGRK